jgi:mRNA-degrading endonuclease RelE of RelBE toxin-antitoxin system
MKIIYTSIYSKKIDKLLNNEERIKAEDDIAHDPLKWPIIQGAGGIRKARAKRGTSGKSGGIRIIYYFWLNEQSIYMLTAYAKGDQKNISETDKRVFRQMIKAMKNI